MYCVIKIICDKFCPLSWCGLLSTSYIWRNAFPNFIPNCLMYLKDQRSKVLKDRCFGHNLSSFIIRLDFVCKSLVTQHKSPVCLQCVSFNISPLKNITALLSYLRTPVPPFWLPLKFTSTWWGPSSSGPFNSETPWHSPHNMGHIQTPSLSQDLSP